MPIGSSPDGAMSGGKTVFIVYRFVRFRFSSVFNLQKFCLPPAAIGSSLPTASRAAAKNV
jgi:hypothetical protein